MGIIVKQSVRNALVSYLGVIIGFISTIKLFPNILDTDQFGLTRTMLAVMFIGAQTISMGLPSSIIKYFPFLSKKAQEPKGIFTLFCLPILFSFLIFSAFFIFFKDFIISYYQETPLISQYYYYILPLVLFSALYGTIKSYISALLDTVFASFSQEILLRLVVIVDLVLFYFEFISFKVFVIIFVLNHALQFLFMTIYGIKKDFLKFNLSSDILTKPIIKKVGTYSLYSFFGGLTMMIVGNIDMLMLSSYEGLSQTGIYAIAFYVGSVISIPRKSVSKISLPLIAKSFEADNMDYISKVYKQTSLNQFLVGFLLFIGVWANMDNLYSMLPQEYAAGSIVILIIGMANLFDLICGANGQILISSDYYRFDLIFALFLVVVAIITNIILIPLYGIVGAALATASSIFTYNLMKLVFVWIKFSIQPFSWRTLAMILNGVFVLLISFTIPAFENIYIDILIRSVLMTILYIAIIWVFNLSLEFKDAGKGFFNKYFR
ncbi:MAG: hypothetical protein CL666_12425 [Balneola sp.]|nr:hypothetical protein [Balneola sp.]